MLTTSTKAQDTIANTSTDTAVQGVRIINWDLNMLINPRYPILYSDNPDTIFIYERLKDNTLVVFDKYAYDRATKRWLSTSGRGFSHIKRIWRRRKIATIIDIKPDKQ